MKNQIRVDHTEFTKKMFDEINSCQTTNDIKAIQHILNLKMNSLENKTNLKYDDIF